MSSRISFPNILVDTDIWSGMLTELSREKFPHTDIIKCEDNTFSIQMSLAGYKKDNINVVLEKSILTVKGECKDDEETQYLMHGITKRRFSRVFPLAEHIEVKDVEMKDGMLKINLFKNLPENEKPKEFYIN
jgi:molecular chaperone IbpA